MTRNNYSRTVYSTETGRICPNCGQPVASCACKKKATQKQGDGIVRVQLDKKGRAGKAVSLITGLSGSEEALRQLTTELKRSCGSGGTLKIDPVNGTTIEIQGDHRDTLVDLLKAKGFTVKRAGG